MWWKETLVKNQKASKYYENDCRWDTYNEMERSEELQKFNPVLKSFQKLKDEEVSKFHINLDDM